MEFMCLLHLYYMKKILTIFLLAICFASMAQNQLKQDRKRLTIFKKEKHDEDLIEPDTLIIEAEPLYNGHSRNNCRCSRPGFKVMNYRTALVYSTDPGKVHGATPSDFTKSKRKKAIKNQVHLSCYTNRMIETKKEFKQLSDFISLEVDWKKEKIAFYSNCSTYKHGTLDSDYVLTGLSVSTDGKTLCLNFRSTFYGVCQGILQLPEWYSFETNTYAIVIPGTVEKITSCTCHYGPDCSNIP
jgi:hypothetical protein